MSSIDRILLPDEQIIFRTKKHKIIFLFPALLLILTLFFLFNSNSAINKIAFLPAIATLLAGINQLLLYVTSEFTITTKRIIMREGFFFKHTNNTRLKTIANVSMDQSLVGQCFNYATVIIHAFGGDADPFTQIAYPYEFQKYLQMQLEKVTRSAADPM